MEVDTLNAEVLVGPDEKGTKLTGFMTARKANPRGDKWWSLEPPARAELMTKEHERLQALTKMAFVETEDKRIAYDCFKSLGLVRTFTQLRDQRIRDWKNRNRGKRVDMGYVYRGLIEDFMVGHWGDAKQVAATLQASGTQRRRSVTVLEQVRARKKGRQLSLTEVVEWVADHLLDDVANILPDDIPSAEALGMLMWAKTNESDFRSMYDAKRMPSKAQIERGVGMNDSGRSMGDLISDLLGIGKKGEQCSSVK